jgi:hypothetical protein
MNNLNNYFELVIMGGQVTYICILVHSHLMLNENLSGILGGTPC